ncbi:hypothetical protein GCM10025879_12180 [Leuconostoc litchii]|nr:hypothetical protein GCM10025879_12180 [Leuconostoc litchii]
MLGIIIRMKLFKNLHNYVKENYESGKYQAAEQTYQSTSVDDYQLGYKQAEFDYKNNHTFQKFPSATIQLVNDITDNKAIEISKFISGYEAAKREILAR